MQSYHYPQSMPAHGQAPGAGGPAPDHPYHAPAGQLQAYGDGEYGYGVPQTSYFVGGIGTWFDFSDACYLRGFLLGSGATLLLTNPGVQRTLVRGAVKLWSFVQGGVEEVKEQFQDIQAEMSQEKE